MQKLKHKNYHKSWFKYYYDLKCIKPFPVCQKVNWSKLLQCTLETMVDKSYNFTVNTYSSELLDLMWFQFGCLGAVGIVKLGSRPCPSHYQITTRWSHTWSLSLLSRSGPRADSIIAIYHHHPPPIKLFWHSRWLPGHLKLILFLYSLGLDKELTL